MDIEKEQFSYESDGYIHLKDEKNEYERSDDINISEDPFFELPLKTFIRMIKQSQPTYRVIHYKYRKYHSISMFGHVMTLFQISGIVVDVKKHDDYIIIGVDDGTDIIECYLNDSNLVNHLYGDNLIKIDYPQNISLGNIVTIIGKIKMYNNILGLSILRLRIENNYQSFLLHKLDVINYTDNLYSNSKYSFHLQKNQQQNEDLYETIIHFIDSCEKQHFTYDELKDDFNIKSYFFNLKIENKLSWDKFIDVELKKLSNYGRIIPMTDNTIQIININFLKPLVIDIIKSEFVNNSFKIKDIHKKLRSKHKLLKIKLPLIQECLISLIEDGIIYQISSYEYTLFDENIIN